jgi:hypothetical protein
VRIVPLRGETRSLHVYDLAIAESEHLEALMPTTVGAHPLGGADELVIADLRERRLDFDPSLAPFFDLKRQDLTGLVGAVSDRRPLPPQEAMWDAAPLRFLREQRRKRSGITPVERLGRRAQLVDHQPSIAPRRYPRTVAAPTVELLYFPGCPHHDAARELVEQIAAEAGIDANLRLREVTSVADAERIRFLGSPSVRVNGHDVEPGADDRDTFTLACRVYRTASGLSGTPPEEWLRTALHGA